MEKTLPHKYLREIRPINIEGAKVFVWIRKLFLEFLNDSVCSRYIILGGDVVCEKDGRMKYTYDNWSVDRRSDEESYENYAARSKATALDYVERYPVKDGILFAPVISSEETAGLERN